MEETQYVDVTTLKDGDEVHYLAPFEEGGFEIGHVQGDNTRTEGVDVYGEGWRQYVGKWFIFKVVRDGVVLYDNTPGKEKADPA